MGCSIERTKPGLLALRFRLAGRHHSIATELEDTRENRELLEPRRREIGADIRRGTFDWETWFPGRRSVVLSSGTPSRPLFVEFPAWIAEKKRLRVRPSRIAEYESHWRNYISLRLGECSVGDLAREAVVSELRGWLIGDRNLSEKTARNVIRGTLRAFARDHRVSLAGFDAIRWERYVPGRRQDPFTAEEVEKILREFSERKWGRGRERTGSHGTYAFVLTLFRLGLRPSEASALRVGDFDPRAGVVHVRRSRHRGHEGATKTVAAERTVALPADVSGAVASLRGIRHPEEHLFLGWDGKPIEAANLADTFRRVQVKLGIRPRPLYQTKHTCATLRLMAGDNPTEVATALGIEATTLMKHYAWALQKGRIVRPLSVDDAQVREK